MMKDDVKYILFTEAEIGERCKQLGAMISNDYAGNEDALLVGILKGSVPFMAELMKNIDVNMEMEFMAVSSYEGTETTGEIKVLKDLDKPINGRDIIIIEDIIDTGTTLSGLKKLLLHKGAKSVRIVTLLDKPSRRKAEIEADYVGFTVANEFVVGFGLDYNQKYRNLPFVGVLKEEIYK